MTGLVATLTTDSTDLDLALAVITDLGVRAALLDALATPTESGFDRLLRLGRTPGLLQHNCNAATSSGSGHRKETHL